MVCTGDWDWVLLAVTWLLAADIVVSFRVECLPLEYKKNATICFVQIEWDYRNCTSKLIVALYCTAGFYASLSI